MILTNILSQFSLYWNLKSAACYRLATTWSYYKLHFLSGHSGFYFGVCGGDTIGTTQQTVRETDYKYIELFKQDSQWIHIEIIYLLVIQTICGFWIFQSRLFFFILLKSENLSSEGQPLTIIQLNLVSFFSEIFLVQLKLIVYE